MKKVYPCLLGIIVCEHEYTLIRPSDGHIMYDIRTEELLNKGEDVAIINHVWINLDFIVLTEYSIKFKFYYFQVVSNNIRYGFLSKKFMIKCNYFRLAK